MTTYTIITDKMVSGGVCIAKINGKTVFIPQTIPGEKLEIQITDSKRDYDTADIVKIIEQSPYRIEPVCPLYNKCGGCNMQHIDYKFQKQLRKNILYEAFIRAGFTDEDLPEIEIISDSDLEYRCRFQLHDGGLKNRKGPDIIFLDDCPIAVPAIRSYLKNTPCDKRPLGRVHVFSDDNHLVIASESEKAEKPQFSNLKLSKKNKKLLRSENKRRIYPGTQIQDENICSVSLAANKKVIFDVRGFFQSNINVLKSAASAICENMSGENLLDMYSGAGTFSVMLSDSFAHCTLVEHNRDALVFAEQNLQNIPHTSYGISGEKWIAMQAVSKTRFDAVVIDPPRSGMENSVRSWLCNPYEDGSLIPKIRSVSCDPVTHARDIVALVKSGYTISKIYLLDFYPQTSHIESLVCLECS